MVYIIILGILILPWLVIPSNHFPEPTRLIKSTAFDFLMMGIIVYSLINGFKFQYKNKYLGWLTAWIFVTIGFNWYMPILKGVGYNAGTIEASLHFILSIIATILVCSNLEYKDFDLIAKSIWLSTLMVAAFAFMQVIGLDPMKAWVKYIAKESRHVAAMLDHPDLLGNYLAICIPFLFFLRGIKYKLTLLLALIVLFFTHSSLSIISCVLSIWAYFLLNSKTLRAKTIWSLLFLCLSSVLVFNPNFNKISGGFTGRVGAWNTMIERMDNYAFGEGLASIKTLEVHVGDNFWNFAHNDYLEIWCATGILGLFLFFLLIINTFRNFHYKDNQLGYAYLSSLVAFLIICCGSFPMEIAPLALGGLISFWGTEKL